MAGKYSWFRESKKGKRLEELVKGSLNYAQYEIEQAFYAQFPEQSGHSFWIAETFEDHLMVSERIWSLGSETSKRMPEKPDEYYKVTFTRQGESITFQPRDAWSVVELTYQEKSLTESVWMLEEAAKGGARKISIKRLMTAGEINGNRRRYPAPVLQAAVEELKTHLHESAGQGRLMLLGEVEHPSDKGRRAGSLMETVIRWTDVEFDGRDVNVSGLLATETEGGKHIQSLVAIGVVPGGSIRGYGLTESVKVGDVMVDDVTELHITGIDVVSEASFSNSQTLLESMGNEPPAEDTKMNLLDKLLALLEARPDLFSVNADQLEAMTESQLQTLWLKISEAMRIDPSKINVSESLREMADKARLFDESQRASVVLTAISGVTKNLPYGDEGNKQFVEAIKATKPQDAEAVKALVEAKRAEYDKLFAGRQLGAMGWTGPAISGVAPVIESETGMPEFASVAVHLSESINRRNQRQTRDLRKAETPAEIFALQVLKRFDEANRDKLIAEARTWQEASTTADLSLPYSVSRAIIAEVFPSLVAANIFDFGLMNASPDRLYYQTFTGETGYTATVTAAALTADLNAWVSLAQKRLTPGTVVVTNEVASVTYEEGNDYVIDYANGKFMALATITDGQALKITYGYTAMRKGEMAAIERGKLTMSYKTIEAAADRLADQISSEAIVFSQSQLGLDIVQSTLSSLINQARIKIDQGIMYLAYSNVSTVANNNAGPWTIGTSQSDLDILVRLLGLAKSKLANRYYPANFILASEANAEMLSNWDGFKRDGFPTAVLNAAGYAGNVKGLPVFSSTEFAEDKIVLGNRQLVQHRVFRAMIVKGPFPTYDSDGKQIAADQYYTEEFNVTESPVAEKGSYVSLVESGS